MADHEQWTIGAAVEAYDKIARESGEADGDQRPAPDPLASYDAVLATGAHPPNECGDPSSCPQHSEQWEDYHRG